MNTTIIAACSALLAAPLFMGCRAAAPSDEVGDAAPTHLDESWRQQTDEPPTFFYADDVAPEVRRALEQAFAAAIDTWGNYGPLEFWVVGADVPAAEALATRYCEHRAARGDESPEDCRRYGRQRDEFVEWATAAAKIADTGDAFLNAGRNGKADWGVHLFSSSLPPGWAGLAGIPVEDDQTVLFHEYFHAVQHAHVMPLDHDERDRLMGPVWFVEGGAEFMAQSTSERSRAAGALPRSRNRDRPWRVEDRMRGKMREGLAELAAHPELVWHEVDYGPHGKAAYDIGAWAVAYLCDKAGADALIDEFYPRLSDLGWEGAFEATFDMTSQEFYAEFDRFLERPIDEQVAVLP